MAPVSLGMDLPPMYQSLLSPYTKHTASAYILSSVFQLSAWQCAALAHCFGPVASRQHSRCALSKAPPVSLCCRTDALRFGGRCMHRKLPCMANVYATPCCPLLCPLLSCMQAMSFSALSSREHMRTGRPRCFERAVICNLVGMYTSSPQHHWGELKPKTAGRRVRGCGRRSCVLWHVLIAAGGAVVQGFDALLHACRGWLNAGMRTHQQL